MYLRMRSVLARYCDKTSKFATAKLGTTSVSTTPLSFYASYRHIPHTSVYNTTRVTEKANRKIHKKDNIHIMTSSSASAADLIAANDRISNQADQNENHSMSSEAAPVTEKLPPLSPADFKIYNQMAEVMEQFVSPSSTFLRLF